MKKQEEWKRPQDIVTFRTSDPEKMLGNYLPNAVYKYWTEDFTDEDTGEVVSIQRKTLLIERGEITQNKLQQILFCIQAGDIDEVEVCKENIREIELCISPHLTDYMVEFREMGGLVKHRYVVKAQNIPQAIRIAAEFGQMYRGFAGLMITSRVVRQEERFVPDDYPCIPEGFRTPAYEDKNRFKVQVRTEYIDAGKLRKFDTDYVIVADEVGEAKERVAVLLELLKAKREKDGNFVDKDVKETIRKAAPFEVDCVVPKEFSDLYHEEPSYGG